MFESSADQGLSDGSGVCSAGQCEGGQAGSQGGQDDHQQPPGPGGHRHSPGSSRDQPSTAAATSTLHEGQTGQTTDNLQILQNT